VVGGGDGHLDLMIWAREGCGNGKSVAGSVWQAIIWDGSRNQSHYTGGSGS
jgi:hypothetical protein